jgi:hypothetical protein
MKFASLLLLMLLLFVPASSLLAAFCPACGYEVADRDLFCRNCGRQLIDDKQKNVEPNAITPINPMPQQRIVPASAQPQPFKVTSHYLNVSGNRLYRDNYFWIAEVVGGQARVWSREGPPYDSLIMGWVSLTELEKRSTLSPHSTIVCAEPPPPTATKVVVVERINFWRHWGPGPFFTHRSYHRPHRRPHCPR